jgi:hypothetical protein
MAQEPIVKKLVLIHRHAFKVQKSIPWINTFIDSLRGVSHTFVTLVCAAGLRSSPLIALILFISLISFIALVTFVALLTLVSLITLVSFVTFIA